MSELRTMLYQLARGIGWFQAAQGGPSAVASRAGRVYLGRLSGRAIGRMLPPRRRSN